MNKHFTWLHGCCPTHLPVWPMLLHAQYSPLHVSPSSNRATSRTSANTSNLPLQINKRDPSDEDGKAAKHSLYVFANPEQPTPALVQDIASWELGAPHPVVAPAACAGLLLSAGAGAQLGAACAQCCAQSSGSLPVITQLLHHTTITTRSTFARDCAVPVNACKLRTHQVYLPNISCNAEAIQASCTTADTRPATMGCLPI